MKSVLKLMTFLIFVLEAGIASANWQALGGLKNGCNQGDAIRDATEAPDGSIYACGGSVTMCAGTLARGLVKLAPGSQSWEAVPGIDLVGSFNCRIAIRGNRLVLATATGVVGSTGALTITGLGNRYIATLDLASGVWSGLGSDLNGPVYALAWRNNDQLFAGGEFSTAGGVATANIASFNFASNQWSAHSAQTTGAVLDLQMAGDAIVAAGRFGTIGGVNAARVARLSLTDGQWQSLASSVSANSEIASVVVNGNTLFSFGTFSSIGGVNARRAAQRSLVGPENWVALNMPVTFGPSSADMLGQTLLVYGGFHDLLALNPPNCPNNCWTELGSGTRYLTSGSNTRMTVLPQTALVFGNLWSMNGVSTNGIARWTPNSMNPLTGTWSALGSTPSEAVTRDEGNDLSRVRTIERVGDNLLAGGLFEEIGGVPSNGFAMRTPTGWVDLSDASRPNAPSFVNDIAALPSGLIAVAGSWAPNSALFGQYVALCNPSTFVCQSLAGGVDNRVDALFVDNNELWVGGAFNGPRNGPVSQRLAVYNLQLNSWRGFGNALTSGGVGAIAKLGSDIVVAGDFTSVNGLSQPYLARVSATGQWSSFGSGITFTNGGSVSELLVSGSDMYVAGLFSVVGGVTARNIAQWNAVSNQWASLGSGLTGGVTPTGIALAAQGEWLYVGGRFESAGGIPVQNIAAWDLVEKRWQSVAETGVSDPFSRPRVSDLLSGPELTVAGDFVDVGGKISHNLAYLTPELIFRARFE